MKTMKRMLALLMMLAVVFTLTACKKDEAAVSTQTEQPDATETTQTTETATSPDDVMLTVNGVALTRGEYEGYLSSLQDYYSSYGYDVTEADLDKTLKQYALQTGIEYIVLDQKLVELNLALTEDEKTAALAAAQEEWDATIQDGLAYYGITEESTEEDRAATLLSVLAELEAMGYTEESYLADSVRYAGYDKLVDYAAKDVVVTDEDVTAYYNSLVEADKAIYENDAAAYEETQYMNQMYIMYGMSDYATPIYYKPAGYRLVTHILLEASEELLTAYADLQATYEEQQNTLEEGGTIEGEAVTAEEVENARLAILAEVQPTVDEIKQKMADGATFAELIPQYTTDTGMMDAESIAAGYEVHMDSVNWVIPFRDQSFTVSNIGDVTEPVVTDYGVHIIQYVGDVPAGPVELTDELFASFKDVLVSSATSDAYNTAITQWTEAVTIEYSAEAKSVMDIAE